MKNFRGNGKEPGIVYHVKTLPFPLGKKARGSIHSKNFPSLRGKRKRAWNCTHEKNRKCRFLRKFMVTKSSLNP